MNRWAKQALAEWRRYHEPPDLEARLSGIRTAIKTLFPKLRLGDALDAQAIRHSWEKIVGSFIASQSEPHRLRNGVLYVLVHQASVRFELERTWKAEVVNKLKTEYGTAKIRDVKFFG